LHQTETGVWTAAAEYRPLDHSRANARLPKQLQILGVTIKYSIQEDNLNTWEEWKILDTGMTITQKMRCEGQKWKHQL
jgi:hypothetical protein